MRKSMVTFGKYSTCAFFFFNLLFYVQKEFHSYLHWFLRNWSSKLQKNLKDI